MDSLAAALQEAGLRIEAIDIAEMAIRNLALHIDRPGRPRAYLHLQAGQTAIEIADGAQVFLSRRVMQDLDAGSAAELLRAQMENLALEVQRSLDYFESQYALGPADRLSVIVCDLTLFEAFAAVARNFLTVQTERFSFDELAVAGENQVEIDRMTVAECREHLAARHFAAGSMQPKIESALRFLEQGGEEVIITQAVVTGKAKPKLKQKSEKKSGEDAA